MSGNRTSDIWIAGAFAAFTVDLVVYPLDTIKTRVQSPEYTKLYRNASNNNGFKPAMFRGLYQGVGSVILATLPASGAFFSTYERVKASLDLYQHSHPGRNNDSGRIPTPVIHALASATAELVSCAILTPAEVIKQNAQMVQSRPGEPRINATVQTLQRFRSDPLALWRGYAALAGRNLPFTALQFPIFERIKEGIKSYRDERGFRTNSLFESGLITAVSAGVGGSIAAVVTTPVDVVKTRIMLSAADGSGNNKTETCANQSGKDAMKPIVDATGEKVAAAKETLIESAKSVSSRKQQSSMQIAREIIQEQGLKGLFRGGALRGIWTMVGSGLYLGVYESGRLYLAHRRGDDIDPDEFVSA